MKKSIRVTHGAETHKPCETCSAASYEMGIVVGQQALLVRLEEYYKELLQSRGIKNPSWIGKNELQEFIDNNRDPIFKEAE